MKRRVHPHEKTGELNIVPYLDIMVNLTMFMLVSMTSVIQFGVLNVVAPPIGPAAASASASPDQPKKELQLSVLIGTKGFFLASANGILADSKGDPKAPIDTKVAAPTIPLKADGKFDYETLTKKMVDIKHQFKDERKVTISADKAVAYEVLVQTMDAVRNDGPEKLFDLVQLGAL